MISINEYALVAKLKKSKPDKSRNMGAWLTYSDIVNSLGDAIREVNPEFSKRRFITRCFEANGGYSDNIEARSKASKLFRHI